MEKPFILGKATQKVEAQLSGPKSQVIWILVLCMIVVVALAVLFLIGFSPAPITVTDSASTPLLSTAPEAALLSAQKASNPECPAWLIALIACFILLQILPLLLAYHRANSRLLSTREINRITFLCEVPMYLGLLGSLLGVCLTQFLTGNLAAPLAYLTTITGIILYIFGRFSIGLALPNPYDGPNG